MTSPKGDFNFRLNFRVQIYEKLSTQHLSLSPLILGAILEIKNQRGENNNGLDRPTISHASDVTILNEWTLLNSFLYNKR